MSLFKRHVLYAPLFRKRHSREVRICRWMNFGPVPSRILVVLLAGLLVINIVFCLVRIQFAGHPTAVIRHLGSRAGSLAVANIIPLLLLSRRHSLPIKLLGIPHSDVNLLHRWFGRLLVLETLAHTTACSVGLVRTKGWTGFKADLGSAYLVYGSGGLASLLLILIQLSKPIRSAFYEIFKFLHMKHLELIGSWQTGYLLIAAVLWGLKRSWRFVRLVRGNIGKVSNMAVVEALPGDTYRVTISIARQWNSRLGQHIYIYLPALAFWQSHPFSVAWSEDLYDDRGRRWPSQKRKSSISLIIRARAGFTRRLRQEALASPRGKLRVACIIEGPYGRVYNLRRITRHLTYIRDLMAGHSRGMVAIKSIGLVWIIQSPRHLNGVILKIQIFVSRWLPGEIYDPPLAVEMLPGRPGVDSLLRTLLRDGEGDMAVSVCGPGSLSDDVRQAVRCCQCEYSIDFFEERFS
ncbi:ferric reductase like transmembrane component [Xylariomycetidae sp. FL2044]|nr:ferric reductase like transmembrane component [Xylariomycetidae sp. FL2044]